MCTQSGKAQLSKAMRIRTAVAAMHHLFPFPIAFALTPLYRPHTFASALSCRHLVGRARCILHHRMCCLVSPIHRWPCLNECALRYQSAPLEPQKFYAVLVVFTRSMLASTCEDSRSLRLRAPSEGPTLACAPGVGWCPLPSPT